MICGACGKETNCVIITIDRAGDIPGICRWCTTKQRIRDGVKAIGAIIVTVLLAAVVAHIIASFL